MNQEKKEWKSYYLVHLTMFILDKLLDKGESTFEVVHYFENNPCNVIYGFDQNEYSNGFQAKPERVSRYFSIDPLFLIQYLYGTNDSNGFNFFDEEIIYWNHYSFHNPRIFEYLRELATSVEEVARFSFNDQYANEVENNPKVFDKETNTWLNSPENRKLLPRAVYLKSMAKLENQLYYLMDWKALKEIALENMQVNENGKTEGYNQIMKKFMETTPKYPLLKNLYPYDLSDHESLEESICWTSLPDTIFVDDILEQDPQLLDKHKITFGNFIQTVNQYVELKGEEQFKECCPSTRPKNYISTVFGGLPHDVYTSRVAHIDCHYAYCKRFYVPFFDDLEKGQQK